MEGRGRGWSKEISCLFKPSPLFHFHVYANLTELDTFKGQLNSALVFVDQQPQYLCRIYLHQLSYPRDGDILLRRHLIFVTIICCCVDCKNLCIKSNHSCFFVFSLESAFLLPCRNLMPTAFMASPSFSSMWILLFFFVDLQCNIILPGGPEWIATDVWDRCSSVCSPGLQHKVYVCVQHDRYNTTTLRPEKFCGSLTSKIPPNATRECNWGDCESKTWWRASNWSDCSQPCGNLGYTTREVECVMAGDEDEITISHKFENDFCDPKKRPESQGACNRFNCPAEFQALDWQKCEQKDPCKSGLQKRLLSCRSLTASGQYAELPQIACYLSRKPPPSIWRRCFIPEISAQCTQNPPVIEEVKMTVVQMRAVRRMRLQVGQEAHILPDTRLSIKCPVKFFPGSNLIWQHSKLGNFSYHTGGVSNETNRRFISKSGNLVIRHFSSSDEGEWRCQAGKEGPSASIMLHYNLPSQGLADWEARNPKRNTEMQNEDPAVIMTRQKLVQWVKGPWSNCSVSCGGQGIQTRVVRCELLDTGVYHVLDDEECKRQFLVKPITQRVCINLPKCPMWKLRNADYSECTDHCVSVGRGTYGGHLACMLGGVEIPAHHCKQMTKPDITCENSFCQAKWVVSEWSKCSVSCGGTGYQYREQKCVWEHSGQSAGSACYDAEIEAPAAVQQCQTRPCKTLCIDLSDHCPKYRHWCSFHTFKYNCCKTCRDYVLQLNRAGG
ncbi:ADAMTS-like protein 3 [Echinococcus granulosus]|uniref:AdamTS protein 3 n=1 Tax=Echinococcus granulosus TaxID=6210 RepID=A0A068WH90_ECHGR|nr:ADAMTS-like protein 3 [Echinococcus granulosus]CDS16974.1 adamTS protein 3 [Echinococcus granulosus]